ncbi:hypothetical protein D3Z55_09490 [Clostridiaceae bacterium]|nr:hypothetical protein [Clostridiaceae bacterium]
MRELRFVCRTFAVFFVQGYIEGNLLLEAVSLLFDQSSIQQKSEGLNFLSGWNTSKEKNFPC